VSLSSEQDMKYQSINAWLECILHERFGVSLSLSSIGATYYRLEAANKSRQILIKRDPDAFFTSALDPSCTRWDAIAEGWNVVFNTVIPAPGRDTLPSPLIEKIVDGYTIHYDIFGLTYWMLSRQEEVGRTDLDEHGRFPATSSHAYKYGYLDRPIVDEWFDILRQVIKRLWPDLHLEERKFSMRVSHDVDNPTRYGFLSFKKSIRIIASDVLKRRDYLGPVKALWIRLNTKKYLHPADPSNTFDWIMDVSERNGLTSAFYFICGRTDPAKDGDYQLEHSAIRSLMRRIHERGHEIGLHPSYATYLTPQTIVAEAEHLKRICSEEGINSQYWGGRMHYLRWKTPDTLYGWEMAEMSYDSTLGYADMPGFRCGTCYEYPAIDPVKGKMLNLRIRPLIAMECTIIAKRYMGLGTGDASYEKFIQLKEACRSVKGCFTLLWHNSGLDTHESKELYESIIEG